MFPEWIVKILENLGLPGAIIFFLLLTIGGLSEAIRRMWGHSNKVYGYRLSERDVLNKALTDAASVLADLVKASEERNDLTSEQAELLNKQSQSFELLKVTILAQYDTIRGNHGAIAQTVSSMADAIRTLSAMVQENRSISANMVQDVKNIIAASVGEVKEHNRAQSNSVVAEVRALLGDVTVVRRLKSPR